jgi:hypothetical protein
MLLNKLTAQIELQTLIQNKYKYLTDLRTIHAHKDKLILSKIK